MIEVDRGDEEFADAYESEASGWLYANVEEGPYFSEYRKSRSEYWGPSAKLFGSKRRGAGCTSVLGIAQTLVDYDGLSDSEALSICE